MYFWTSSIQIHLCSEFKYCTFYKPLNIIFKKHTVRGHTAVIQNSIQVFIDSLLTTDPHTESYSNSYENIRQYAQGHI